jgi:hypothetical protein
MKNETRGRDRGRYLAVTYPIGHYLDANINRQQTARTSTVNSTDNIQYLVKMMGGSQLAIASDKSLQQVIINDQRPASVPFDLSTIH